MVRNHLHVPKFETDGRFSRRLSFILIILAGLVLLPAMNASADDQLWPHEGNGGRYVPAPEDLPPELEGVPGIVPFNRLRVMPQPHRSPGCPYKKKELKLLV